MSLLAGRSLKLAPFAGKPCQGRSTMRHLRARSFFSTEQVAHCRRQTSAESASSHNSSGVGTEFSLATTLDMACVTLQTWRTPNQGDQYLYHSVDGTTVQFLNKSYAFSCFAGVIKIVVEVSEEYIDDTSQVSDYRAVLDSYQARFASKGTTVSTKQGTAYLWLEKGFEKAGKLGLSFERMDTKGRRGTETAISACKIFCEDIGIATGEGNTQVRDITLQTAKSENDVELKVSVQFIPLGADPAFLDDNLAYERNQLISSLEVGGASYTLQGPEDRKNYTLRGAESYVTGSDAAYQVRNPDDFFYEAVCLTGEIFPDGFWQNGGQGQAIAYIENQATDTQLIVFWNQYDKQLAVTFQSTERKRADILSSLKLLPAKFDETAAGIGSRDGKRQLLRWKNAKSLVVHYGYLKAWRSVQAALENVLRQAQEIDTETTVWKTFYTGHSLGGALASLAVTSAIVQGRASSVGGLYTFGSPPVGNDFFVHNLVEHVPQSWRMFHPTDIILQMMEYVPIKFSQLLHGLVFVPSVNAAGYFGAQNGISRSTETTERSRIAFPDEMSNAWHPITIQQGNRISEEARRDLVVAYRREYSPGANTFAVVRNLLKGEGFDTHRGRELIDRLLSVMERIDLSTQHDDELKNRLLNLRGKLQEHDDAKFDLYRKW